MGSTPSNVLFVGNISQQVDRKLLFELGCQAGPVLSVAIPQGDNGNKGFAFIEFEDVETTTYAIKLFDGLVKMHGRVLRVAYGKASRSKPEAPALTPASQAAAATAAATEGRTAQAGPSAELASTSAFNAAPHQQEQQQQQLLQQLQAAAPQFMVPRYISGGNAAVQPSPAAFEQLHSGMAPQQQLWHGQPAGFAYQQVGALVQQQQSGDYALQQSGGYVVQQAGAYQPQLASYQPQLGSYQPQQQMLQQQQQQHWGT